MNSIPCTAAVNAYSQKHSKFLTDINRGKRGEIDVMHKLSEYRNVTSVLDVSDNDYYREREIDAIIYLNNRPPLSIEIKTDYYEKTGNIVFEVLSSKKKQSAGGFTKTQSDFIIYYFPNINTMYAINTKAFQDYIRSNRNTLRYCPMGDDAEGFLIPIRTLIGRPWFIQI